jgi:hypothetical protein
LIAKHRAQITELCLKYGIKRLELFGSAARGDSSAKSDIDFFYEFDPVNTTGLADRFFAFQQELEKLLGLKVDLVSAADVTNPYFLQVANRHRLTLYAA